MSQMIVRAGGNVVLTKPVIDLSVKSVDSRWSGDLEDARKTFVHKMVDWILPTMVMTKLTFAMGSKALAAGMDSAEKIRQGFSQLLDVFTAISEPILWFYALTACIMIATKNKDAGWNRLKQVGYAYAGIALLPTFFAFLRWVADLIKHAISF